MPVFFRELRDQYPHGLPHEHSLRATLIKRGFNPKAIDAAVRAYRETMEFVDAETEGATTEVSTEGTFEEAAQSQPFQASVGRLSVPPRDDLHHRLVLIPLSVTEWATLQAPFPLSEAAWNQMMAVLNAMKPALVASAEQAPSSASQQGQAGQDGE
jgi:hypothetical protein